ncbi:ornithine aminotransferase, mitochondrial-like isoform X2 [Belonocnema kinseyi]|uniref:ornithine aminotransferase, mitochondrial-like isoform X2 n=1 Tax=Belonocnema kinseyi TaxID=2817044 RepID=UPI00143DC3AD|nr:ornithine aminotransferase, mitochondrial-like isoform X2 [Belonocnema kinseyi]
MLHSSGKRISSITLERTFLRYFTVQKIIDRDQKYGGQHFKPLPVVLKKGEGCFLWDIQGKRYIDFISGFATVNQGHCHPRLVNVMREQTGKLTHTSRAFFTEPHGELAEYLTKLLGWDRFLTMNTGVEAGDTALKMARRWGYRIKKIPENKATVIFPNNNYWGRSLAAISASTNAAFYEDFGPLMPLFDKVPFDDLNALERKFNSNPNICAFMMEPIQGEAGVLVPKIMLLLEVGTHGSTFGGSPLGQKIALEAVRILEEEKLADNASKMGAILREELQKLSTEKVVEFRGRGLLAGLVLNKARKRKLINVW